MTPVNPAQQAETAPNDVRQTTSDHAPILTTKIEPRDAVFVLFASGFLLLVLLWIANSLNGSGNGWLAQLPSWITSPWSKLFTGSGSILTGRWWGTQPKLNYLAWILGVTTFFLLSLFPIRRFLLKPITEIHYHLPIQFALEASRVSSESKTEDDKGIVVTTIEPSEDRPVGLDPIDSTAGLESYAHHVNVPDTGNFVAEIVHKSILSRYKGSGFHAYEYQLCLKLNTTKSIPAGSSESAKALVKLKCSQNGCMSEKNSPRYLLSCDDDSSSLVPSVAYADGHEDELLKPGWVVPSLDTLNGMTDRQRVGYTRFEVEFTPADTVESADHYYFSVSVNGQPTYVDGIPPHRITYPLQKATANKISFALENLNFAGKFEGREKLSLTVVFLKTGSILGQEELEREYIALRDADDAPPFSRPSGVFIWTGKYITPSNENKYELFVGSGTNPQALMVDQAQFDKRGLSLGGYPLVGVIRPPLPKKNNPSYGLVLGQVMPTSQIQFTFDNAETHELCQWAARNSGKGKPIRSDYGRYDLTLNERIGCN